MADPVWTQEDYEKLKAAALALACGESVQTITFAGPPQRTITYQQQDLGKIRSLLSEVAREVQGAQTFRRVRFQKGFRDVE